MSFNIGQIRKNVCRTIYIGFRPMSFNIGQIPLYFNLILMTQTVEPVETTRPTLDWIRQLRTLLIEQSLRLTC